MKINAGNIQKGQFIIYNTEIWQVMKASFYSPGKGAALMRTSLKNIKSGRTQAYTYKSNEEVETIDVETRELQYLYKDATLLYFMDNNSYEQFTLNLNVVGNVANYLKEGDIVLVLMSEDKPINIRPPKSVKLKVIEAEEGAKGNTMTAPKKNVKVETGVTMLAPIFIKVGDTISINPETGEYLERVGQK
jgi:elongation factor P